ncbi:MAG: amidase, partial [Calditrichales bacterium]
ADKNAKLPENRDELAFYSIPQLANLIRTKQISSVELTTFYLDRLKKFDEKLHCVITLTEELALQQAARADAEIKAGTYRGLLHGIPYGIKDLFAVKEYKTTWGAMPYKDQTIPIDAEVVNKLRDAGAVLVAKLTMGALAWGDVWFGGKTRNPWDLEQGSSGSSAGSASATAAGLVPFAIGTETWGSIVSPSTRCGTTGLRPTYGQVSRAGAMALSWSMDKAGPICRSVEDCAIVFAAIHGADGHDPSSLDVPFQFPARTQPQQLRVGYLKSAFDDEYDTRANDQRTLQKLKELNINLVEMELPDFPVDALSFILSAESAAAFDELTRSGKDDLMVRQIRNAWPNSFRAARFIPAVEYIQANRIRYQLIQKMQQVMEKIDLFVTPSYGGNNLLLTNLTGHPCVVLPNGFTEDGHPTSISFIGNLYDEGKLMSFAQFYQQATDYHLQHPKLFTGEE